MDAQSSLGVENEPGLDPNFEKEESFDKPRNKPVRLSLHLIVKRHLPPDAKEWSQQRIIEELNKIKRVRLDRENLCEIDSLELLSSHVTHLYLQHNRISQIQNLECLPNLQILVLSNNCITEVEGISHLQQLVFLDLSENSIESYDTDEIPKPVIILNLKGNPCASEPSHRKKLIKSLSKLRQLDEQEVLKSEKIEAGVDISSIESDDEEEEDDDEEEEENEEERSKREISNAEAEELDTGNNSLIPSSLHYKQLPKIHSSIQTFAAEMLIRSQNRMEDVTCQHKRHIQEITNARIKAKIRPIPQLSKPK